MAGLYIGDRLPFYEYDATTSPCSMSPFSDGKLHLPLADKKVKVIVCIEMKSLVDIISKEDVLRMYFSFGCFHDVKLGHFSHISKHFG